MKDDLPPQWMRHPRLRRFLDVGGPDGADPFTQYHVRATNVSVLSAIVIIPPFIVHYARHAQFTIVMAQVISLALAVAAAVALRRYRRPTVAAHLIVIVSFGLLFVSNVNSGGFYDPNFGWLYVVPVIAAVLVSMRAALGWGLLIVLVTIGFWLTHHNGVPLPNRVPEDGRAILALLNRLGAEFVVIVGCSIFVIGQRIAQTALRKTISELSSETESVHLLLTISDLMNQSSRLDEAAGPAMRELASAFRFTAGRLHVRSPHPRDFLFRSARLVEESGDSGIRLPRLAPLTADIQTDVPSTDVGIHPLTHYRVSIPLLADGEPIGVLEMFYEETFVVSARHLSFLARLSSQLVRLWERERATRTIQHLAYKDSLTGLPNRAAFTGYLHDAIDAAAQSKARSALLFMDLDRFKAVNDTLGHSAGDALLKQVSQRLRKNLRLGDELTRLADREQQDRSISRLGGDEFCALVQNVTEQEDVVRVAKRIMAAFERPFQLKGNEVHITPSIGIALFPDDADDVEGLFMRADTAMYQAKSEGPGRFCFFDPNLEADQIERVRLQNEIRRALEQDRVEVFYQPIVDAADQQPRGLEALARLRDDNGKIIPPVLFIPVAEETGMIRALGQRVMDIACRFMANLPHGDDLVVSVNVSALQLAEPRQFVHEVQDILMRSGLDPKRLELEITESLVLHPDEAVLGALTGFRHQGIRIAIDDFGTGYSALSSLRNVELDRLKIDRSFMRELEQDEPVLIPAVVALAKSLGLEVVVEGVERGEDAITLRDLGADFLQGYYFSRPMPADAATTYVRDARLSAPADDPPVTHESSGSHSKVIQPNA